MKHALSEIELTKISDSDLRIGIVHSSYYKEEVGKMISSAKDALVYSGIKESNITEYPVVGAFEIPLIGSALADAKKVDALIGFGVVVQGETQHAQAIVAEAARGMMDVQTQKGIPFAFEILHVDSLDQARERVEVKGREAAVAVLSSLNVINAVM
ncbi:6,7-dimethyl-8-ribityllumazine synthase [Patescibacteria group bacterium]|nr:6,7-dimethyl-8-ribityllumazine synthase [Patescibacteria group bacterium]